METKKPKLVPSAIEMPSAKRNNLVIMLNQTLADLTDLKTHAKQAHWNVQGENFTTYHKLFDKVAEEADGFADMVAERCAQIGGFVNGRLSDAAKSTTLPAFPDGITQDHKCLEAVLNSLSHVTEQCRRNIEDAQDNGDYATSDMFIDITRGFDKLLWMTNASSL
jgi:starvation-inducible DNA-binding protein